MAVEQTFESLLQTSFQNPKNQIEVLNAGIGGERTDQALMRLNQDVIAKKPDICFAPSESGEKPFSNKL